MESVTLAQEEQTRHQVIDSWTADPVTTEQAATLMGVSALHIRRILAAHSKEGVAALAHGHRGRRAPNATPRPLRSEVLRLARSRYPETSHTHLSELLRNSGGMEIGRTKLRRMLSGAGLQSLRRRRPARHRIRRQRKPCEASDTALRHTHCPVHRPALSLQERTRARSTPCTHTVQRYGQMYAQAEARFRVKQNLQTGGCAGTAGVVAPQSGRGADPMERRRS